MKRVAFAVALSAAALLFAQSEKATLSRVYVGTDGLAHIVDATGKDTAFPKEKDQVPLNHLNSHRIASPQAG